MSERDVPPTNNGSEQAIRPSTTFRKVIGEILHQPYRTVWKFSGSRALNRSEHGNGWTTQYCHVLRCNKKHRFMCSLPLSVGYKYLNMLTE